MNWAHLLGQGSIEKMIKVVERARLRWSTTHRPIELARAILDYFMSARFSLLVAAKRVRGGGGARGPVDPLSGSPGSAVAHLPLIPTPGLTIASSFLCSCSFLAPLALLDPHREAHTCGLRIVPALVYF